MGSRSARVSKRLGSFVVLVGPDGVGKTTIARAMLKLYGGCTGYVHFRPSLWSPLPAMPSLELPTPVDKGRSAGNTAAGIARLLASLVLFWAGYLTRVLPAVKRGCLVVGDRWSYGYVVQPLALGFFGPDWFAKAVVALMPRPDLLVALEAPVGVVLGRKDELTGDEVSAEIARARSIRWPRPLVLETVGDAQTSARRILDLVGRSPSGQER